MGMDGADASSAGLRAAMAAPDAALVEQASGDLHHRFPARSAKRVVTWKQAAIFTLLVAGLVAAIATAPTLVWRIAHGAAFLLFFLAIICRLFAAASLAPPRTRLASPTNWPTYTILAPLYREADVVFDLIAALDRLDYPREALDIQVLVEADDLDTIAAALAARTGPHVEVVAIPAIGPRTKPKALNVGLARARGEFIAVYDAEDRPHPHQLRAALAAFAEGGSRLACVQAPLAVDNADAAWIARQFAAEYAIQFREVLPLLARLGLPLPLGGTSNHFRVGALRLSGGWDSYNVTEDADLGYRLARDGWQTGVIAPPTWEEAPVTLKAWLGQRRRWIKGHMQTWLVLMREPVRAARQMGLGAFLSMQLVLAGGIFACLLHGPLALLLLAAAITPFDLLGAADFALAMFGYCVAVFAALTASALSADLSHARAAPTMPLYWPLASLAAFGALAEIVTRPHHWTKTAHGVSKRRRPPAISDARRATAAEVTPNAAIEAA